MAISIWERSKPIASIFAIASARAAPMASELGSLKASGSVLVGVGVAGAAAAVGAGAAAGAGAGAAGAAGVEV